MRYAIFALFLLSAFQSPAQTSWESFVTIDGKFRVRVPAELTMQEDTLQTDIGDIRQLVFYGQDASGDLVFVINCFDYPEATVHSDSTDLLPELFQATLEQAVASVDGELQYQDDWQYDDYPGKFWRIDYLKGEATLKTRAFVAENRLYSIQVASPANVQYSESTLQFLDSFELLE